MCSVGCKEGVILTFCCFKGSSGNAETKKVTEHVMSEFNFI